MDHCQLDHGQVARRELLEPRGDATALLEPAHQSLDGVALPIRAAVEAGLFGLRRLIRVVWDDGLDAQPDQILSDPPGVVGFVPGELPGPVADRGPGVRKDYPLERIGEVCGFAL